MITCAHPSFNITKGCVICSSCGKVWHPLPSMNLRDIERYIVYFLLQCHTIKEIAESMGVCTRKVQYLLKRYRSQDS